MIDRDWLSDKLRRQLLRQPLATAGVPIGGPQLVAVSVTGV